MYCPFQCVRFYVPQNNGAKKSWTETCKTVSQNNTFLFSHSCLRHLVAVMESWPTHPRPLEGKSFCKLVACGACYSCRKLSLHSDHSCGGGPWPHKTSQTSVLLCSSLARAGLFKGVPVFYALEQAQRTPTCQQTLGMAHCSMTWTTHCPLCAFRHLNWKQESGTNPYLAAVALPLTSPARNLLSRCPA